MNQYYFLKLPFAHTINFELKHLFFHSYYELGFQNKGQPVIVKKIVQKNNSPELCIHNHNLFFFSFLQHSAVSVFHNKFVNTVVMIFL